MKCLTSTSAPVTLWGAALLLLLSSCAGDGTEGAPPYGTTVGALGGAGDDDDERDDAGGCRAREERDARGWPQWGHDPAHGGAVPVEGQEIRRQLGTLVYDPFVAREQAETFGELLAHYQVPLLSGDDVFTEAKAGTYIPCDPPGSFGPDCGPLAWNSQVWTEKRLRWQRGHLVEKWSFASDWKPERADGTGGWEPVFHAALANGYIYVPGAAGSVFKLDRRSGRVLARITPLGPVDADSTRTTFVAGPLSADAHGNIFYNAIRFNPDPAASPFGTDVAGAWLVRIDKHDRARTATFASLTPGAPAATDLCTFGGFTQAQLPWPPSPSAQPGSTPCGSQRPGLNVAPAIAPDGTIYTISRSHFLPRWGYVVAVNPDLTPRWSASLRDRLHDGCGGPTLPPNGTPGGCRAGANPGVDPATNEAPAGLVIDLSSSSPTVAPDGSVLYGAYTRYNYARGHLFKFSASGRFLGAYDFGWDTTPAIYRHHGGYSVVIKDNHYEIGSYCGDPAFCPAAEGGPFYITQLKSDLTPEWHFKSTNTQSCQRNGDGTLTCVSDHPNGFEWCINAPAVDRRGVVYANSEDGNLYTINQGGRERDRIFLNLALGAAYTPLAISESGLVYTENAGSLFVIGR